jgi:hypothetical protein
VSVRPSLIAVLLVALAPLGCSGPPEMALVNPAKYEFYDCAQLGREIAPLIAHADELRMLYRKAAATPAGLAVAKVSYDADYLTTIGNISLVVAAARERKCDPPVTAPPQPASPLDTAR